MSYARVKLAVHPPRRLWFQGSLFSLRIEDFSDEDLRAYGMAYTDALIDRAKALRAEAERRAQPPDPTTVPGRWRVWQ